MLAGRHERADCAPADLGTNFGQLLTIVDLAFVDFDNHLLSYLLVHVDELFVAIHGIGLGWVRSYLVLVKHGLVVVLWP